MRLSRSAPAVAIGLLLAAQAAPAVPPAAPAVAWDVGRAEAVARLDRARDLAFSGRVGDAVMAAAELGGVPARALEAPAAGVPRGLPPAVAGPVARLLGAVRAAEVMTRGAIRTDRRSLARAGRETLRLLTETRLTGRGLAARADGGPALAKLERLRDRVERVVDREALSSAALLLARTIDETLPALRAAAPSVAAPARPAAGCDLADVEDVLCVGGLGDNTYTADYALQVDLGGGDVYRNSAGGADMGAINPGGNGLPVSVAIDAGGADTYAAAVPLPSGARTAQGGGFQGGVGILVDAAGDDSYTVTAGPGGAGAQGHGFAEAGVGVLADLAGNDAYRLHDPAPAGANIGTIAAGHAFTLLGGAAVMLDLGVGNDTHMLEAHSPLRVGPQGQLVPGYAYALGFGWAAVGAVSIFANDGGSDALGVHATTDPVAPGEARPMSDALAVVNGWGLASLGSAVSLTGPGPTVREAVAEVSSPKALGAVEDGFGLGFGPGGFAGTYDAGGDDIYRSRVSSVAVAERTINDSCGCAGVKASAESFVAEATGLGFGWAGGTGVALDAAGDDRYEWRAELVARAVARDERETDVPPAEGEVEGAVAEANPGFPGAPVSLVQGVGLAGAGFFEDTAGDDTYLAVLRGDVSATATSLLPLEPTRATARGGQTSLLAQGAGYTGLGQLRDLGGTDRYEASVTSSVTADPPSSVEPGTLLAALQAAAVEGGVGLFLDADGGAADTFDRTPDAPACSGHRGQGVWVDCGQTIGLGVNA